jgi:prophage regulatory protein
MTERFLRFAALKAEKGIPWTRPHLDRLEKAGLFPRRVRLSASTVMWVETEIDALMNARAAERTPGKQVT